MPYLSAELMPTPEFTNPIVQAILGAGLTPIFNDVKLSNFALPYVVLTRGTVGFQEPLPTEELFPWQNNQEEQPQISLMYFWLHDCTSCAEDAKFLSQLSHSSRMPNNLTIRLFLHGTNASKIVADDVENIGISSKVYLDPNDGIGQRLGVIGSPSVFLLDEKGFVVGYFNGRVDFDTPGFDILLARIASQAQEPMPHKDKSRAHQVTKSLREAMLAHTETKAGTKSVNFLVDSKFFLTSLGLLVVLCYPVFIYLRWRSLRRKKQKINS